MNGGREILVATRSGLALGVGVLCLLVSLLGWFLEPRQFFISYLFAELVWLGVALGCMAFLMIHYLTGGKWGWPVRRMFEAAAWTLPVIGLLFIPIFFGIHQLYPWANPARVAADHVLQHKQPYMSPTFFIVRAVIVFGIWSWLAYLLNNWSRQQDATHDPRPM
jgi:hypothetical protein